MCFLKHLKHASSVLPEETGSAKMEKNESDTEMFNSHEILSNYEWKSQGLPKLDKHYFLMNCLGLMQFNSTLLKNLDQKLESTQNILNQSFHSFHKESLPLTENPIIRKAHFTQNIPQKDECHFHPTSDALTQKLFGSHQYTYKLELSREFPELLFKERNFAFGVKLVEITSGKEQRNGNLLNISVGVCDKEGEWIHETKEGLPFIKGKVESELYHGEGEFCKLAPRDVSRIYQDKVVNLVVYCKPSLLKYSGQTTLEENIDYESVEPLIIRDITIKAKKRD